MSEQLGAVNDAATIKVTQPTQLRIMSPDGEPLLTIHTDGRWEFRDDAAPTEAARVFVREVERLVTVRLIPPGRGDA